MIFDTITDVEDFYKSYAHDAGFSVRIGQQKKQNEEILIKRYLCSREGYKKEDEKNVTDASGNKRTHNVMEIKRDVVVRHILLSTSAVTRSIG